MAKKRVAWNKGKTAKTDPRLAANAKAVSASMKAGYATGRLKMSVSEEARKKISATMKKAHAEGRAYSWAHNRGRAEPSYAEKFFAKVIDNDFDDKTVLENIDFSHTP